MLTVEGPWSPDRRRRLSSRDENGEKGEPLSLTEIAARIEAESPRKAEIPISKAPAGGTNPPREKNQDIYIREYVNVRQRPDEGFRRYFLSDYFKLWVWYESDKETLTGFQLLWGGGDNESAITWKADGEFSHRAVADEGLPGAAKMTQVLEGDAGKIRPSTLYIFARYAARVDPEIVHLVVTRVMEKTGITQAMMDDVAKEHRKRKSQGEGRAE